MQCSVAPLRDQNLWDASFTKLYALAGVCIGLRLSRTPCAGLGIHKQPSGGTKRKQAIQAF